MTENSEYPLALPVGTELVGDYVITKVLGAGGFGITYEARERSLDRVVAIKEYFPIDIVEREGWALVKARSKDLGIKYSRGLRRFIEEAKAITQFNHPNIVRVLRYFKTNNTAFMVLHYEEGVDMVAWREALKKPPSELELSNIIHPLLDALELIHASDFLHRDLAPDNIIIRKDGSPILIDFGSARSELTFNSKTVSALVKSGYSPFEQYAKNSKEQGPWTDIYSFGATLYQMVTGEAPPDSLSRLAVDEMIPTVKRSKKYYSRDFLKAIDSALAIKIPDRPQSISEWRSMLFPAQAYFETTDPAGAHISPSSLAHKKKARTAYHTPHSGLLLKKNGQSPVADLIKKAGLRPADISDNAARLAAKVKAPLLKLVPHASRAEPKPLNTDPADQPYQEVSSPPSLRSLLDKLDHQQPEDGHEKIIENAARKPPTNEEPAPEQGRPSELVLTLQHYWQSTKRLIGNVSVPFAISKPLLAGFAALGALIIGLISFRADLADLVSNVDFPRAITTPGELFAPNNTALVKTLNAHDGRVLSLRLAKNGKELMSMGADQKIKIWNADDGLQLHSFKTRGQTIKAVDLGETNLVQTDSEGNASLLFFGNPQQFIPLAPAKRPVLSLTFSGRRNDVITGGDQGQLSYWKFRNDKYTSHEFRGQGHTGHINTILSHKRYIITGSHDHTAKIWGSAKRSLIRTYRGHTGPINALAISPKAYRLATGSDDGTIKIWSPRAHRARRTLKAGKEKQAAILSLEFAPNGKWLAAGGADHTLNIWNARNGDLLRSYQTPGGAVRDLLFSSDGKRLITAGEDGKIRFWDWNARPTKKRSDKN